MTPFFNPKGGGGGSKSAQWVFNWLPFLTGSCYGHKNSWLYPQTSQLEGTKVIFWLSGQVFQKFSRDRWKITIFLERKSRNRLFFNFFITKVSYFVSNLNDNFHEASFEVYYVSLSQKLVILYFSPNLSFGTFCNLIEVKTLAWIKLDHQRPSSENLECLQISSI